MREAEQRIGRAKERISAREHLMSPSRMRSLGSNDAVPESTVGIRVPRDAMGDSNHSMAPPSVAIIARYIAIVAGRVGIISASIGINAADLGINAASVGVSAPKFAICVNWTSFRRTAGLSAPRTSQEPPGTAGVNGWGPSADPTEPCER